MLHFDQFYPYYTIRRRVIQRFIGTLNTLVFTKTLYVSTTVFHIGPTKNSNAEFPLHRSFSCCPVLTDQRNILAANRSKECFFGENAAFACDDNGVHNLFINTNRSKEGIVGEVETFNNFFNYSFFNCNFFDCFFNNSNFFNSFFNNSSFFSYYDFSFSISSADNFFSNRCSGNEKSDESSSSFVGEFNTVNQSSSLEGFSSEFNTAFKDSGYHFRGDGDAVGSSESYNSFNVNCNSCNFFNSNSFVNRSFFSYNGFVSCNFFSSSFVDNCGFSSFSDGHNSRIFRKYSGSHSSTHKSCKNERKSLLHFFKILLG